MNEIKHRTHCPISYALDIFGDKWSLLIIRDLMFQNKKTYGEFLKSEERISTNILADRLAMLECAGLLSSKQDTENKSRKIYSLTAKAIDLVPVIIEIINWSATYDFETAAPKEFIARIRTDKQTVINELTAYLKSTL
ncbi:MAG: helix-turn-helix transcriptional regulator [Bacteroidetes bacterium]|nr:helix-turn-helix transcriptional regulator [Bacteroidota bacterium]